MDYEHSCNSISDTRPPKTCDTLAEARQRGARYRWERNLPVSVGEASDILGVPYSTLAQRVRTRGLDRVGRVGRAGAYMPDDLVEAALEVGTCH